MPAKKKSEVSPLPPPAPTASPRTTRSRKRALDEVLEQSDETVATELTVLDTAAPSQPATAVRALPVRFASRRQGEQPATKAAPPKKRSREAVLQEKLARIEAEQAALNQRRAEYAQWELDQDAIMEEDAENAVTSLSDIEGEGKDVEMEDADDKEYASGQGDESSEAEVTKETSKAPVVSFSSERCDMCTDGSSRRGRSPYVASHVVTWTQLLPDLLPMQVRKS